MKVQEFIERFNDKNFNIEESLEVKKYIPIMEKKKLAIGIIAECTDDIDDFITVDKFKANIHFEMKSLEAHTNLEVASDYYEMIEQYDALCENGAFDKVIDLFKKDHGEVHKVLEMQLEDMLVQNSIDAQVAKIANKISKTIDIVSEKLNDIDISTLLPEGANLGDLNELFNIMK